MLKIYRERVRGARAKTVRYGEVWEESDIVGDNIAVIARVNCVEYRQLSSKHAK